MRAQVKQSKKANGPLGIRIRIWLIAFGAALACVLTISLSSRHKSQLVHDAASESLSPQASVNHDASPRRAGHIEFTPAIYQDGERWEFDEAQLTMIEQMTQDRRTWWDDPR